MDDKLIGECIVKARTAFRRSLIATTAITVVFLVFALDWILRYAVYPANHFVVWSDFPQWIFPVKSLIVLVLFLVAASRLGGYATFNRFVDTKAKKLPQSLYVIVQRHRNAVIAEAAVSAQDDSEAFEKRVRDALL